MDSHAQILIHKNTVIRQMSQKYRGTVAIQMTNRLTIATDENSVCFQLRGKGNALHVFSYIRNGKYATCSQILIKR